MEKQFLALYEKVWILLERLYFEIWEYKDINY